MFRPVLLLVLLLGFAACKDDDKKKNDENDSGTSQAGEAPRSLDDYFKNGSLPYALTDTGLQKATDTTGLPSALVASLIADSVRTAYFGKGASVKYGPLARLRQKNKEIYYVVKATAGTKKAAFLLVFDDKDNFGASYPFLLPDADAATWQTSNVDKNLTVTKAVTLRGGNDAASEGKEVVAYDASSKSFSLIMMDVLADNPAELVNPIDTFPKSSKLAGDYYLNKKNIIAVRDGRHPNQLLVYIHTENANADCIGQLKGEFILTSGTSAAYRQPGDPCVLNLTFSGNSVSMREETGCGNYRGLDCPLTGTFTKRKPASAKPASGKSKRK